MTEQPKRYPDENEIEKILDTIYNSAWNQNQTTIIYQNNLGSDLFWVLEVWSKKYLGHERLTKVLKEHYGEIFSGSLDRNKLKELDLVICFFQHYIYAFEEFMTREFRDSVIRCGLASERLVNRLAIADNHPEVIQINKFEMRVNKLMSLLDGRIEDIHFLINRMKYVYSQRSKKGAHDTGAAGILIAKFCISEMPITYMEYLNVLEKIGYVIKAKEELIAIVNDTVSIGTTMLIAEKGEPLKPEAVLSSLYSQRYFEQQRTFSEIKGFLVEKRYNFPDSTLWKALNHLCSKKMLQKIGRGIYVQRIPPERYFNKKIT